MAKAKYLKVALKPVSRDCPMFSNNQCAWIDGASDVMKRAKRMVRGYRSYVNIAKVTYEETMKRTNDQRYLGYDEPESILLPHFTVTVTPIAHVLPEDLELILGWANDPREVEAMIEAREPNPAS